MWQAYQVCGGGVMEEFPTISLLDRLKNFIGHIAYSIFLWSLSMTNEQYLDAIYGSNESEE